MADLVLLVTAAWLALAELMWAGPVERWRLRRRWANTATAPLWATSLLSQRLIDGAAGLVGRCRRG